MMVNTATRSSAPSPLHVDYEALVADYERGLVDRLRGFGASAPDLDLWVPDEDPMQSLLNMFDAAATVGIDVLHVVVGPQTLDNLDLRVMLVEAARFANVAARQGTEGITLELTGLHVPQSQPRTWTVRPVPPKSERPTAVQEAVPEEPTLAKPEETFPEALGPSYGLSNMPSANHADLPIPGDNERGSHATVAGLELGLVVDDHGLVVAAGYDGAPNAVADELLGRLCKACHGLPVLEVRDHAILRLEFALRTNRDARACAGVVIPEAVSPAFSILQRLVRETAAPLLPAPTALNEYDFGPSGFWLSLGDEERAQLVGDALAEVAESFGLHASAIALQTIQIDVRVVVALNGVDAMLTIPLLVAAERALKDEVDARLELVIEELRDGNKKRRLAIITTP